MKSIYIIPNLEVHTHKLCKFYMDIYKRMKINFGYTYHYWLSDMSEEDVLKNILNLVISNSMRMIFINVAIRIKKNNNRQSTKLQEYKLEHPDVEKCERRKIYYDDNIVRISEYNKMYNILRNSRINIFKKIGPKNI